MPGLAARAFACALQLSKDRVGRALLRALYRLCARGAAVWPPLVDLRACCRESATTLCGCLHTRPLACLPQEKGACLGTVAKGTPEWGKIAGEAARTVPGRENGGNCDIKNLSRGCKVYFPVFVEGANLSMGDMHFSQGDGEVSFCGAIG